MSGLSVAERVLVVGIVAIVIGGVALLGGSLGTKTEIVASVASPSPAATAEGAQTAGPSPTPSAISTASPEPTAVLLATASPAPTATQAPKPPPTPTPKPTMSLATLKSRFKAVTNTMLDQRQTHMDAWAAAATYGDWVTADSEMRTVEKVFTTYANAIKALPWPTGMRTDSAAVRAGALKCSLDASVLSTAASEYDPAYTTYAPALLSDWTDLGSKILVLNGDF